MSGKFNKIATKRVPTARNEMGEKAYNLSAREELVATCLTTFLQDAYYEKEKTVVDRIITAIKAVNDPFFVAQLAIYLRHTANMRSVSHLLAGELARSLSGSNWGTAFYQKVYGRPDDMAEILAYVINARGKRKVPNTIRKAFANILAGLDPYTIDKYKMKNRTIKLVDLVNLVRPKPTQKNQIAYERLMKGESLDNLYENKTLEKTFSAAGQKAVDSQGEESVEDLKGDAFRTMLLQPKGMPIMSLLRNLRNLLLFAPDMATEAVRHLTDKNRILNSKQLPFRFATAYNELLKMDAASTSPTGITFEKGKEVVKPKKAILDALEIALGYSIANIPELPGNTAILVDHSSSVRGHDGGGGSKLSAFGVTTGAMVGNLLGTMYAYRQDNVYIGLFGDRLIPVPIDRKTGVLDFNKKSFALGDRCGGSTENGLYIFLDACIKEKTKVDNLIIFSDMVIGAGGRGGWDVSSRAGLGTFQELFKRFKALNPQCRTITVDIRQTSGKSVFDKSLNVTQVAGWSTSIFDVFANASKGYAGLIKEIEAIEI